MAKLRLHLRSDGLAAALLDAWISGAQADSAERLRDAADDFFEKAKRCDDSPALDVQGPSWRPSELMARPVMDWNANTFRLVPCAKSAHGGSAFVVTRLYATAVK